MLFFISLNVFAMFLKSFCNIFIIWLHPSYNNIIISLLRLLNSPSFQFQVLSTNRYQMVVASPGQDIFFFNFQLFPTLLFRGNASTLDNETRSASEVSLKHFYPLLAPSGALVFYHGLVIDPQQQPTCQPLIITYKKNQGN